ncbi:MAG: hypothetical protein ACOVP5_06200, partial [Chitinophagales bacterium]
DRISVTQKRKLFKLCLVFLVSWSDLFLFISNLLDHNYFILTNEFPFRDIDMSRAHEGFLQFPHFSLLW